MDHWRLPGPAGFLEDVVSELREGSNVVIGAPAGASASIRHVLFDRVADCSWRVEGPISIGSASPLDLFYDELDIRDGRHSGRTPASLIAGIGCKKILIVDASGRAGWPAWRQFIDEYAHASRALALMDRPLLLVITSGIAKNLLPPRVPALRCFTWDGCIGEADVFAYVIQWWRKAGRPVDARAKLVARIVVRLALWDFDLIDRLLGLQLHELFDPLSALRKVDVGFGTGPETGTGSVTGDSWEQGGVADFDGVRSTHSLVLSRRDDPQGELTMRLWAAQAAELLPVLELERRKLAERMKATGRMPRTATLNGEPVHDLNDVEVGGLLHLARVFRFPPDVVRTAENLRDVRNKLAHLTPIKTDEALSLLQ